MLRNLSSTGQVARRLGVRTYQLTYLLETEQLPEPRLRVAGKRAWTDDEIEEVARVLRQRDNRQPDAKEPRS